MDRRYRIGHLKLAGLERPEQPRARDIVPGRGPDARRKRDSVRAKLRQNCPKTKVASFLEKLAGTVVMRELTPAQKAYMNRMTGNTQGQGIPRTRSARRLDWHLNTGPGSVGLNTELHAPGAGIATADDMAAKAKARQHFDQVLQQQGKATGSPGGATAPAPVAPAPAGTVASTPRSIAAQGGQGTVASTPRAMARSRPQPAAAPRAGTQVTAVSSPGALGTANTQVAKVKTPAAYADTRIGPAPKPPAGGSMPKPGKVIPMKPKPKGGLLRSVGKLLRRAA